MGAHLRMHIKEGPQLIPDPLEGPRFVPKRTTRMELASTQT